MTKKSKEGAAAHAIRTVEVPDCPAVRVKVMGGGALPAGGTTGQVLTKKSDADGDVAWKDAGGGVFIDVEELPATDIDKDTFYRKSENVYVYNQQELDPSNTVWYGDGMHGFIEVIDEGGFIAYNVVGDIVGYYLIDALTVQEVNSLLNADIIAVKDSFAESKFFGTPNFFGFSELVTIEKGNYKLFHNPTSRPGKYIEVGGLPKGGTTGQVLTKKSDADGDVEWKGGAGSIVRVPAASTLSAPVTVRPIDASVPATVRIPSADIGIDASYDILSVQSISTPYPVIVVNSTIDSSGNLILTLISARTTEAVLSSISFTAYFIKK